MVILNRGRVATQGTVSEVARRAAAPRTARLRVAAEHVDRAMGALRAAEGVETAVLPDGGRPGWLVVTLAPSNGRAGEDLMREGLRALLDNAISLFAYELEGARLSDAFPAVTEAA